MGSAAFDIKRLPYRRIHGLVGPDRELQLSGERYEQVELDVVMLMNRTSRHRLDFHARGADIRALPQSHRRVPLRVPLGLYFGRCALDCCLGQRLTAAAGKLRKAAITATPETCLHINSISPSQIFGNAQYIGPGCYSAAGDPYFGVREHYATSHNAIGPRRAEIGVK